MIASKVIGTAILVAGVLMHAGCGATRSRGPAGPAVPGPNVNAAQETAPLPQPLAPTLEEGIGKIRRLMAEARPPAREHASKTLETGDRELMAALALAAAQPTADRFDDVAAIYYQRGLLDLSHDYSNRSLKLNPAGAVAHERLARIWRDWGAPHLALGDIHRAIFYAPKSASARNTLGTILQSLGQPEAARSAYQTVLALDERAAYAYNNLCYLSFLKGLTDRATLECRIALTLDPKMTAARNNLALTYAAAGRPDLARHEFGLAAGSAATAYNMGMVYMSMKRFDDAAGEFAMAHAMSPPFTEAGRRAVDARRRAFEDAETRRSEQP